MNERQLQRDYVTSSLPDVRRMAHWATGLLAQTL